MGVNRKRGEERGKDGEIGIDGEGRGFSEVLNSNIQYALQCQFASSCQISYRSAKPFRRYGRFSIFKMAAVRHLGFVIGQFGPPTKCILVVSVTVQNLAWFKSVQ